MKKRNLTLLPLIPLLILSSCGEGNNNPNVPVDNQDDKDKTVDNKQDVEVYNAVKTSINSTDHSRFADKIATVYSYSGLAKTAAVEDANEFIGLVDELPSIVTSEDEFFAAVNLAGSMHELTLSSADTIKLLLSLNENQAINTGIEKLTDNDYVACGKVADYLYTLVSLGATVFSNPIDSDSFFQLKDAMCVALDNAKPTYNEFKLFSNAIYNVAIELTSGKSNFTLIEKVHNTESSMLYSSVSLAVNLLKQYDKTYANTLKAGIEDADDYVSGLVTLCDSPLESLTTIITENTTIENPQEMINDFNNLISLISEGPNAICLQLTDDLISSIMKQESIANIVSSFVSSDTGMTVDYANLINSSLKALGIDSFMTIKDGFDPSSVLVTLLTTVSLADIMALSESDDLGGDLEKLFGNCFEIDLENLPTSDVVVSSLQALSSSIVLEFVDAISLKSYVSALEAIYAFIETKVAEFESIVDPVIESTSSLISAAIEGTDFKYEALDLSMSDVNKLAEGIVSTILKYDLVAGVEASNCLAEFKALSAFVSNAISQLEVYNQANYETVMTYISKLNEFNNITSIQDETPIVPTYCFNDLISGTNKEAARAKLISITQEATDKFYTDTLTLVNSIKVTGSDYEKLISLTNRITGLGVSNETDYFAILADKIAVSKKANNALISSNLNGLFGMCDLCVETSGAIMQIASVYSVDATNIANSLMTAFQSVFADFMQSAIEIEEQDPLPFAQASYVELATYAASHEADFKAYLKSIYDAQFDVVVAQFEDDDISSQLQVLSAVFTTIGQGNAFNYIATYLQVSNVLKSVDKTTSFEQVYGYFQMAMFAPLTLLAE